MRRIGRLVATTAMAVAIAGGMAAPATAATDGAHMNGPFNNEASCDSARAIALHQQYGYVGPCTRYSSGYWWFIWVTP